jgi:hypothetical protein
MAQFGTAEVLATVIAAALFILSAWALFKGKEPERGLPHWIPSELIRKRKKTRRKKRSPHF